MKDARDFTITFLVEQSQKKAFLAISDIRGWWCDAFRGAAGKNGDEFTVQFDDIHYSKQKLVELIPDRQVVWQVTESVLSFLSDKEEWTGTQIRFDVSAEGDKTRVRFTHHGLRPGIECFDACSNAWQDYINNSLRKFIATGKGTPFQSKQITKPK